VDPTHSPAVGAALALLVVWSLVWKGVALWKAARRDQPLWYIALLIFNTAGILDMLYIFIYAPRRPDLISEGRGDEV
jgi:hypothetical protein